LISLKTVHAKLTGCPIYYNAPKKDEVIGTSQIEFHDDKDGDLLNEVAVRLCSCSRCQRELLTRAKQNPCCINIPLQSFRAPLRAQ
jgi:hypothetical protein